MKISEIITDKYKLRIPPIVYYDLLADVVEAEEEQEPTTKTCKICRNYGSHNGVCDICKNYSCFTEPNKPQEPQTFKWCETCKEYDQEKHCCHRWSKVIRDTIEEMKQEPFINKPCVSSGVCEHDKNKALDKIRAEITDCLKALDEIEKSGLNIYLPNEISGRRLTYQQCLKFIDKYKSESEHN